MTISVGHEGTFKEPSAMWVSQGGQWVPVAGGGDGGDGGGIDMSGAWSPSVFAGSSIYLGATPSPGDSIDWQGNDLVISWTTGLSGRGSNGIYAYLPSVDSVDYTNPYPGTKHPSEGDGSVWVSSITTAFTTAELSNVMLTMGWWAGTDIFTPDVFSRHIATGDALPAMPVAAGFSPYLLPGVPAPGQPVPTGCYYVSLYMYSWYETGGSIGPGSITVHMGDTWHKPAFLADVKDALNPTVTGLGGV